MLFYESLDLEKYQDKLSHVGLGGYQYLQHCMLNSL